MAYSFIDLAKETFKLVKEPLTQKEMMREKDLGMQEQKPPDSYRPSRHVVTIVESLSPPE